MKQFIGSLSGWILILTLPVTIFLVPIFFLPYTADFFVPNKQLLLIIIASIALIAFCLRSITHGEIRLTLSPAIIPLFILSLVYLLSSYFNSPNSMVALLGRTSTIISLAIIFITTTSTLTLASHLAMTLTALTLSLFLISIFTIAQSLGVYDALNLSWLNNKLFNPVGSPLLFLTLAAPTIIFNSFLTVKLIPPFQKIIHLLATITIAIASALCLNLLLSENGLTVQLLPYSAGWSIAVDTSKTLKTALLGTGPSSFTSVYSQLKPAFINNTSVWNLRFTSSSNEFFHLLTTVGFLGLLAYLFATLGTVIRSYRATRVSSYFFASRLLLILTLTVQLFLPTSIPLLTLTFVALALTTIALKTSTHSIKDVRISLQAVDLVDTKLTDEKEIGHAKKTDLLPMILLGISLLLLTPSLYYRFRVYASELYFYQSLRAASENKGIDTYNLQIKAISLYPQSSQYHLSYSQTNIALANALARQGNLSDQDKANASQLISQAIREAKVAASLDPQDANTWVNLATIYRQLINVAKDADKWTIAAYSEAIKRDPLNPQLRIELGGIFYSLGQYEPAIKIFSQAVDLKLDWPNSHYNLAAAYRENRQYQEALQSMRIVVELVGPTTADYQKAQDELRHLEALVEKETATTKNKETVTEEETELALPSPIPSPAVSPIELPEGSGPNVPPTEESPTN